jgi:hypothetical protein
MKRSSFSTWVYLLLVFASGAALGVFSDHIYTTKTVIAKSNAPNRDPNESKRKHIEEMRTRLKLAPAQVTQLTLILDETRGQMHDVMEKYKPEMESIHNAQVDRVKAMLSDTQRGEYVQMLAEREAKRAAESKKESDKK